MGFSATASHVIFVVAMLGAASVASSAAWSSWKDMNRATESRDTRVDERVHTHLEIDGEPEYNATLLTYNVTVLNNGSIPLRVSEVTFVLDGLPILTVGATSVDGNTTTDLWLPGERLAATLEPVASAPTHLRVAAGNGASAYYPR